MSNKRNVAIVGVGLIGRAWAAIFARAGWNVRLTDPHAPTLSAAPGLIRDELRSLAKHGLADDPDGAASRISVASSLADALEGVEFVFRMIPTDIVHGFCATTEATNINTKPQENKRNGSACHSLT